MRAGSLVFQDISPAYEYHFKSFVRLEREKLHQELQSSKVQCETVPDAIRLDTNHLDIVNGEEHREKISFLEGLPRHHKNMFD